MSAVDPWSWFFPIAASSSEVNPVFAFAPILMMLFIFYFLLVRPQQKKEKERRLMIQNLKKGDRVVTMGGIIGTVVGVKDNEVVLRIGDGDTKLECLKNAVSELRNPS